MADEPKIVSDSDIAADANGGPMVHAHAQYIRDFSFENPDAMNAIAESEEAPAVNFNCAVESRKLSDTTYEVILKFEGKASRGDKTLFLVSLDYAGLFTLSNIPAAHVEGVINVHCPTMLFPFARNIIANATRDGGYPQLLIDIIDFNAMFEGQKQAEAGSEGGDAATDA